MILRPWEKLGLRVEAAGTPLSASHAMLPTPWLLDDRVRLFFASCDADLRGRIFSVDLEREAPFRVIERRPDPVMDLGPPGAFDCDGINPSCIVPVDGGLRFYTIGWRRGITAEPYTLLAGVAHSLDQGVTFDRQTIPLLPPSMAERLFRTAPSVWQQEGRWKMLYIAGSRFVPEHSGKALPRYGLYYMESADGLEWPSTGECLLEPDPDKGQIGFGRPVLHTGGARLLLSVRTVDGYVLVDADWTRMRRREFDYRVAVPPGPERWDSEMTCFGSPVILEDQELLFYNGNRFGMSGIGLARRPLG